MANEEVKVVEVVETPDTEETQEVVEKKARKPRAKVRPVEETIELSVKKLSDKEKDNLIEHLKEELTLKDNQLKAYKDTIDASFRQTRETEENYKAMESYFKKQLNYIAVQLTAFQTAVEQATKGGVM